MSLLFSIFNLQKHSSTITRTYVKATAKEHTRIKVQRFSNTNMHRIKTHLFNNQQMTRLWPSFVHSKVMLNNAFYITRASISESQLKVQIFNYMPQYNYTFWRAIKQHINIGSLCMQNEPVHKKTTPGVLRWLAFNWKTRQKEVNSCQHCSCSPSAVIVRFLFFLYFLMHHIGEKMTETEEHEWDGDAGNLTATVVKARPPFLSCMFLASHAGSYYYPWNKKNKQTKQNQKNKKTRGNKLLNSHGVGWYKPCECDAISGATN